jgi:hypothetical protein
MVASELGHKLWHDNKFHAPSIGCSSCDEYHVCGGLCVKASIFDCLDLCCRNPQACDKVCVNNPRYPDRVREVEGFSLDNIPRSKPLKVPCLPSIIPLIYHEYRRSHRIFQEIVALPFYKMLNVKYRSSRFKSHKETCAIYGIQPGTPIILSGTDRDNKIESWWGIERYKRRKIIKSLKEAGVAFATTPNYSLFTDVPRMDDLHAIKRIGLVHYEFLDEGLPAALHVNARTEWDYDRWTKYIDARPEITHIAFEFGTGAKGKTRREWHVQMLSKLAKSINRPIELVLRGGVNELPILASAFSRVIVIDTSSFMKTINRKRALLFNGHLDWGNAPTEKDEPLDALLTQNISTLKTWLETKLI